MSTRDFALVAGGAAAGAILWSYFNRTPGKQVSGFTAKGERKAPQRYAGICKVREKADSSCPFSSIKRQLVSCLAAAIARHAVGCTVAVLYIHVVPASYPVCFAGDMSPTIYN